jgi:hypothetical protein
MDQLSNHPLYRKYNIDSAMNSLWEFYKKNFITLFIVSFAMSLVIQYVSTLINIKDIQAVKDPVEMLEKLKEFIWPMLTISLVNLFFYTIIHYYIIYHPVDSQINIFSSVLKSMRYFVPYLVIMVFLVFAGSIAIFLGVFALVVGAFIAFLYVFTLYLFILPVLMVEGINIGNSIARIFKLTHRGFWTNIAWVSVFLLFLIVISIIFSGIILLPFSGNFLKTLSNPGNETAVTEFAKNPLYIILSALTNALTFPVMPIFACILYFNGKAGEENILSETSEKDVNDKVKVEDLYAKPYSDDHPDNPDKEKRY